MLSYDFSSGHTYQNLCQSEHLVLDLRNVPELKERSLRVN